MSFDFPFVRLFGVRKFCYYPYVQYIQYTIACYTKYVSNEEMYRDEQFSKLSRNTYSFIYVINEFA